jgi:hypothetical protein
MIITWGRAAADDTVARPELLIMGGPPMATT